MDRNLSLREVPTPLGRGLGALRRLSLAPGWLSKSTPAELSEQARSFQASPPPIDGPFEDMDRQGASVSSDTESETYSQFKAIGESCGLSGVELARFVAEECRKGSNPSSTLDQATSIRSPSINVIVPSQPKVRKFWGQPSVDKDFTVEDFIESVNTLVLSQGRDEQQRVRTVLSYLEGEARREVKSCGTPCNTIQDLYAVLRKAFGDTRTLPTVYREFATVRQGPRQTVREFANEVYLRFAVVQDKQRTLNRNVSTQEVLIDQFCEGVRDRTLAMELLKMTKTGKQSFAALRDFAIEWERVVSLTSPEKATRVHQTQAVEAPQTVELKKENEELRKKLDAQSQKFERKNSGKGSRSSVNFEFTKDGKPICAKCGEAGHVQRFCPQKSASSPSIPLNGNPSV